MTESRRAASTPDTPTPGRPRTNRLAWVAVGCAVLAWAGMFGYGASVLAVFGVGAGHVALQQIRERGERGAGLALAALVACYALGVWGLGIALVITFDVVGGP